MRTKPLTCLLFFIAIHSGMSFAAPLPRPMEQLGRGIVAVNRGNDVYVSWRLLGNEPDDIAFNVYRGADRAKPKRLNAATLNGGTHFIDIDVDHLVSNTYSVRAIVDGVEQAESTAFVLPPSSPVRQYIEIPLRPRPDTYVHLAWVGDLDGDGEYDFVVDRLPNEVPELTQKLEAYRRDGTFLWAVDLGPRSLNPKSARWNAGAATISNGHNDGVTVYDLDQDGKAEVILKSARGVIFGDGKTIDAGDEVQQFVSVLDGQTGAERARTAVPSDLAADGPLGAHLGIAYLDGQTPSIVFKGKNRRADGGFNLMTNTWSFDGTTLKHGWKWIRPREHDLQDFHQIRIADVDGDGRDELCDGSFVLDDNGSVLYHLKGVVHGDRFHIGDLDPDRPGLEGFGVQQNNESLLHVYYYDAATGEVLRRHLGEKEADIGRGIAADVDPQHRGYEYWAFDGIYSAPTGAKISTTQPWPNFRIWWDGDALSENLNREQIEKWNPQTGKNTRLLTASRDGAVDSWRDAPLFYGDILGDWREEVIYEHRDHSKLMIYTTTIPTDIRLYTLPHNPMYRAGLTVKGYMQSHMVDYYLGDGMTTPAKPNIIMAPNN